MKFNKKNIFISKMFYKFKKYIVFEIKFNHMYIFLNLKNFLN